MVNLSEIMYISSQGYYNEQSDKRKKNAVWAHGQQMNAMARVHLINLELR